MFLSAKNRKRMMSVFKRRIGNKNTQRLREKTFQRAHKLRGFPNVKKDLCVSVDEQHLLLNCRLLDPQAKTQKIGLRYANGNTQWIDELLVHYRTSPTSLSKTLLAPHMPDRFAGLIVCEQSHGKIKSLVLQLANGKTRTVALMAEKKPANPLPIITRLLKLVPRDSTEKRRAFDEALGEIIGTMWKTRQRPVDDAEVINYNWHRASGNPKVSLVIPIYGRYDFIEHQLAQFTNDPYLQQQEIIYVIDDPRIRDEIKASCDTLARIYRIAFKVVYLNNNLGYAGANNSGVSYATSPTILLLNSDVFPAQAGWLETLVNCSGDQLQNTLLGARLLYEDDSIQHDGMEFFASPFANNLWINMHPGKGLPCDQFPSTIEPQPRESVTGACLLLSKDNYERLGGFDESYILGDFEDSDLCMKARSAGLQIAIAEDVTLYHLERQSQSLVSSDQWKNELTFYNCWYHTQKWDAEINQLKQESSHGH